MKISNPTAIIGEEEAVEYLRKKGYKVIERNFRKSYAEIDIIAVDTSQKPHVLVFVEVKTRTGRKFGSGLEAISYWKLNSIRKAAEYYKITSKNLPDLMRIDAVSVDLSSGPGIIDHVKNITDF